MLKVTTINNLKRIHLAIVTKILRKIVIRLIWTLKITV